MNYELGPATGEGELWVTCKGREKVVSWEHPRSPAGRGSEGPLRRESSFPYLFHLDTLYGQNLRKNLSVYIYRCVYT